MATDKGLEVDPAKVRAISEMPAPTDKLGVQRLLGLAQYLAKFLPHLSDVSFRSLMFCGSGMKLNKLRSRSSKKW